MKLLSHLIAFGALVASCAPQISWAQTASPAPASCPCPSPTAHPATPTPEPTVKPLPSPTSSPAPSSQPTTQQTLVKVPAGANLVSLLTSAKANTKYQLALKSSYVVNGSIVITQANVTLDLNGSDLSLIPSMGATSNIKVSAAHFEIGNGMISKALVFIRTYGDATYVHDLVIPDGAAYQFLITQIGGTNAKVENCKVGVTQTVSLYTMASGTQILNSSFSGSVGEDSIRQDNDVNGHIPNPGMTLNGVTVSNTVNAFDKEAVSFRMGSGAVLNSIIHGYIRAGQATASSLGSNSVGMITFQNNSFALLHSPQLAIKNGVIANVVSNTFLTDAAVSSIAIGGNSKVTMTNNLRKLTAVGVKPKPAFWSDNFASPTPIISESGTTIK